MKKDLLAYLIIGIFFIAGCTKVQLTEEKKPIVEPAKEILPTSNIIEEQPKKEQTQAPEIDESLSDDLDDALRELEQVG